MQLSGKQRRQLLTGRPTCEDNVGDNFVSDNSRAVAHGACGGRGEFAMLGQLHPGRSDLHNEIAEGGSVLLLLLRRASVAWRRLQTFAFGRKAPGEVPFGLRKVAESPV